MARLTAALAGLGAIALLAGGCGSGGGDTNGIPTGAVGRTAYIAKADGICARANAELTRKQTAYFSGKLKLGPSEEPTGEQIATFAGEAIVPSIDEQLKQLRALEAPAGDAGRIEAVYDAAQKANDRVRSDPALVAGDADPYRRANRLAGAYGMRVCAQG